MMDKHTKALLTVIAFCVLALPVKAEEKVWYCEMTGFATTDLQGAKTYKKQTFKMKVSPSEVVFGTGGYFSDSTIPISSWFGQNSWIGSDITSFLYFREGTLNYTQASWSDGTISVTARCDDF